MITPLLNPAGGLTFIIRSLVAALPGFPLRFDAESPEKVIPHKFGPLPGHNLEFDSQLILHFHGSATHSDRCDPKVLLFQFRRAAIMAVLALDAHFHGPSLSMDGQITQQRPLPFSKQLDASRAKTDCREFLAVQHLRTKHGLLNLGPIFFGNSLVHDTHSSRVYS